MFKNVCWPTGIIKNNNNDLVKVIVSLDWGGLQMILLDRLEVFNISAAGFLKFCCRFCTVILKMAA